MFSSHLHPHPLPRALSRPRRLLGLLVWLAAVVALTGCGVDFSNPPRLATATARAAVPPTTTPAPLVLPAPTATGEAIALPEAISPVTGIEPVSSTHLTLPTRDLA